MKTLSISREAFPLHQNSKRRGFRVKSEKSDYVSGKLSNSEAFKRFSQEHGIKTDPEIDLDLEELTVEYVDSEDFFNFEEGWTADILDPNLSEEFEEEKEIDFRSDPRFHYLSVKSIERLEKHTKNQKTNQKTQKEKEDIDESSRSTRTTANPHKKLRIVGGKWKGRRLLSPRGRFVRPMMERVRAAIFDMLFAGNHDSGFAIGTRWLDLYAGTGAVGLEAMSRGCGEAFFVEMDPWVVSAVLKRNIDQLDCEDRSMIRTMKVEDFLDRLIRMPQYSSGPFDFVSVCPPYKQVSYPELQQQIEDANIIHEDSVIFMEYPKQLKHEIRDSIGPLMKVKDRSYGRTLLAVYANQ